MVDFHFPDSKITLSVFVEGKICRKPFLVQSGFLQIFSQSIELMTHDDVWRCLICFFCGLHPHFCWTIIKKRGKLGKKLRLLMIVTIMNNLNFPICHASYGGIRWPQPFTQDEALAPSLASGDVSTLEELLEEVDLMAPVVPWSQWHCKNGWISSREWSKKNGW